jgi:hypothetical protein
VVARPVHVDGPVITQAPAYVEKWHRALEWAWSVVAARGDVEPATHPRNTRIAGWRSTWVFDVHNEEEAFDKGIPVEWFGDILEGPNRELGGSRRVSVRLYTWMVNSGRQGAYDPQWITTGWGMSARAASHAHGRWIDAYGNAVAHGVESRRLIATAMEVVFWTAGPTTDYV